MNKRVKIAIVIALMGVFAILVLQTLWMVTSYNQEKNRIIQKATNQTKIAIDEYLMQNSTVWYRSIKKKYGPDIIPYMGGGGYNDSLIVIKVYNPETGLCDRYEKKCNISSELVQFGAGVSMLYHACGLDLDQFNLQLDSVFQVNGIYIPYYPLVELKS